MAEPEHSADEETTATARGAVRSRTARSPIDGPDSALLQSIDSSDTAFDLTTVRYRPAQRPPTAVLWVMDDDQESAERVRIREASLTLGRGDAGLAFPHDSQISSRHAEISRRLEDGRWNWYLKDLNSTNGTFVKVAKARLSHGWEFRVGYHQFRFELAEGAEDVSPAAPPPATLIKLAADGPGERYTLDDGEHIVGRDPSRCWLALEEDPTVSPEHARIYCDDRGRWHVADANTLNGVWLRVNELRLASGGEFELGEQRFRITFV